MSISANLMGAAAHTQGFILAMPEGMPDFSNVWLWLERHGAIVYPLIGLLVIGLIAGALFTSWRADEMASERKGELKMQVLQLMRRRISGVSAEQLAAEFQIEVMLADRLLSELVAEGYLDAVQGGVNTPTQYRLRRGVN